jgi:hypothetical protein
VVRKLVKTVFAGVLLGALVRPAKRLLHLILGHAHGNQAHLVTAVAEELDALGVIRQFLPNELGEVAEYVIRIRVPQKYVQAPPAAEEP